MSLEQTTFDTVVIGCGPAGLSAALALGRATRRVLLAGHGPTRNAVAQAAHNLFTRDGTAPAELIRIGRAQLAPYDVTIRDEQVEDVQASERDFLVHLADGSSVRTRGIVLATGIRDMLPDIPGFQELWGKGVFHCPYCHGWEVAGRPLAIYASGETALHLARLIRGWSSDLILFSDGPVELPQEQVTLIRSNGIVIREERIARLVGSTELEAVILKTGDEVPRSGLFMRPAHELRSDLAHRLGCALSADGRVEADSFGRTGVPRVFVAGDAGPNQQSVASAAASGTVAGVTLNLDLLSDEFQEGATRRE